MTFVRPVVDAELLLLNTEWNLIHMSFQSNLGEMGSTILYVIVSVLMFIGITIPRKTKYSSTGYNMAGTRCLSMQVPKLFLAIKWVNLLNGKKLAC